jgi:hypothetical protein
MRVRGASPYILPAGLCLVVFVALNAGFVLLPRHLGGERTWRGAYTLLVEKSLDIGLVTERLAAAGIHGVLSAATARVGYSVFDGQESVRVADIPLRFASEDLRLDPWLRGAGAFFTSLDERWHVIYLPVETGWLAGWGQLSSCLDALGANWQLVEKHPPRQFFFLAVFAVLVVFMLIRFRRVRGLAGLLALPWLNCVLQGSLASFSAAVLAYVGLVFFLDEALPAFRHLLHYGDFGFQRAEMANRLAFLGCALAAGLALSQYPDFEARRLGPLLLCWFASACLAAARAFLLTHDRHRREHRPFLPVSLLPRKGFRGWARDYGLEFRLIIGLLLCMPLLMPLVGGIQRVSLPKPAAAPGVWGRGPGALEQLWMVHRRERLPDLSDYLAHRAYQAGLAYGREYGFPGLNEKLVLSEFRLEGGSIKKESKVILSYDDSWHAKVLNPDSMTGIERLLAAEPSAGEVLQGRAGIQAVEWGYAVLHAAALAFLLAPFVVGPLNLSGRKMPVIESLFARRKQQEA